MSKRAEALMENLDDILEQHEVMQDAARMNPGKYDPSPRHRTIQIIVSTICEELNVDRDVISAIREVVSVAHEIGGGEFASRAHKGIVALSTLLEIKEGEG